jgi:hypothetical protein
MSQDVYVCVCVCVCTPAHPPTNMRVILNKYVYVCVCVYIGTFIILNKSNDDLTWRAHAAMTTLLRAA